MKRAIVVLVVVLAACGGTQRPAEPAAEPAEPVTGPACAGYVMQILPVAADSRGSAYPAVHGRATVDHDAAAAAHDAGKHADAARLYLDCARHYREVPDGDPLRDAAQESAAICYYDAIYSFANAGRLAAEGRAALEREAKADPRLAPVIEAELAKAPSDCGR